SQSYTDHRDLHSFPTRRSSDLSAELPIREGDAMLALYASLSSIGQIAGYQAEQILRDGAIPGELPTPSLQRFTLLINMPVALERSEEHTSELQSRENLVCRLLL